MKWPFALRSSADTLKRRCDELDKSAREWASLSLEHQQSILQLNRRLVEITDLDRTTPELMANVFSEWASDQQATFFNVLGRLTHEWEHARCMQFGHIQPDLDDEGRWLLVELAQYAERS